MFGDIKFDHEKFLIFVALEPKFFDHQKGAGGGGLLFLLKVICFKVIKVIFQILALFKVLFFSDSTMIYHNFSPPFGE